MEKLGKELEFKIWDKDIKRIIEWDELLKPFDNYEGNQSYFDFCLEHNSCYVFIPNIGLKDKNGKDVYVGFIYSDLVGRLWQVLEVYSKHKELNK